MTLYVNPVIDHQVFLISPASIEKHTPVPFFTSSKQILKALEWITSSSDNTVLAADPYTKLPQSNHDLINATHKSFVLPFQAIELHGKTQHASVFSFH